MAKTGWPCSEGSWQAGAARGPPVLLAAHLGSQDSGIHGGGRRHDSLRLHQTALHRGGRSAAQRSSSPPGSALGQHPAAHGITVPRLHPGRPSAGLPAARHTAAMQQVFKHGTARFTTQHTGGISPARAPAPSLPRPPARPPPRPPSCSPPLPTDPPRRGPRPAGASPGLLHRWPPALH